MSSYEFWDELGKIFNAVVAYQEKNLEFNKRFISPWIRLGNVFEKQDRNQEALRAYERAIEIDGANPQNWFEMGNIHFKMENHAEAVDAFNRAIELDPSFGWAHNNLALTLASTGEMEQAVALYQQAIELLPDAKDKAVAWNRLGNAYRKLNQYEQALEAFHRADELDRDNAGFRDSMDEVSAGPSLMATSPDEQTAAAAQAVTVSPIELIVADNRADEDRTSAVPPQAELSEPLTVEAETGEAKSESEVAPLSSEALVLDVEPEVIPAEADTAQTGGINDLDDVAAEAAVGEHETLELQPEAEAGPAAEETVTVVVQDSTQTFTETLPIAPLTSETAETSQAVEMEAAEPAADSVQTTEIVTSAEAPLAEPSTQAPPIASHAEAMDLEQEQPSLTAEAVGTAGAAEPSEMLDPAPNSLADQLLEAEPEVLDVAQQAAYEAFLKDTSEPISGIGMDDEDDAEVELPGSPEPVAKIDESGELQIEMDTKNAHVWNELGNVYFNTSAYDDAIVAYSKAIELDRWFAWPYSNLALAYVQKRRFVEAILLYQRSIELFSTDKDKAISWNRLGNVYRRLNDYENAIAAYQRADALDPDNSTLSLQSRFSLLGNYAMEQKPSYVS